MLHKMKFVTVSPSGLSFHGFSCVVIFAGRAVKQFLCGCGRSYKHKHHLVQHLRYECGTEPAFPCPYCSFRTRRKGNLKSHLLFKHKQTGGGGSRRF
ncbi:longitudinals lacking protein, isoforms A/B/D/L-like isoform X1 [Homalodisca vitripennis]|uniref:longitudinals lacking protein, isoforms A/B/D/L-like isoform X1 n=1 Tax=Homalodisca vitripennis TaxID=197043 RepID=UPI001EE9BB0D|nr:longitudinals lacking protein, isoforms A/B/D/L-like isoform X1 [Homalodisca vitripennis]